MDCGHIISWGGGGGGGGGIALSNPQYFPWETTCTSLKYNDCPERGGEESVEVDVKVCTTARKWP